MPHPLVTADELAALLQDAAAGARVRVLDVRWSLGGPAGRPLFDAGHIPGAVYVDLDTELAGHGEPRDGRHPLPDMADFQAAARGWGLNDGDTVVVYDDWRSHAAVRAWWLLRYAGVADVRVLDGALPAWLAAGRPLATSADATTAPAPGTLTVVPGGLPVLTTEQAGALPDSGVLLDARAAERYRGDVEPIDPRAGHIPGALSAPTAGNLDAEGRFLEAAALRERYEALGVTDAAPVGVYCGSGITAAHDALALTLAGFAPALFPGSWSAWANRAELPVATGPASA
ncbi:sulfurtransferase [Microterricola viridarii]|uniref:Thiosulfate/3-mercaptopyruvate sulfurtransferase n=1 Tax=Microterricola viridarii TaxID=412690 RepID=A0A1H1L935_9MICO|nr:sulfurtransferase [Microterricola viridarii]SDR70993.1 thiosulfate/3-mercaptopyruvate sulfurtransferase [Microterricola viridarii]SDT35804.1 thiosulfate/3-mercaptopyruvate sulfurtransferase [Microterricola viridarii]